MNGTWNVEEGDLDRERGRIGEDNWHGKQHKISVVYVVGREGNIKQNQ